MVSLTPSISATAVSIAKHVKGLIYKSINSVSQSSHVKSKSCNLEDAIRAFSMYSLLWQCLSSAQGPAPTAPIVVFVLKTSQTVFLTASVLPVPLVCSFP